MNAAPALAPTVVTVLGDGFLAEHLTGRFTALPPPASSVDVLVADIERLDEHRDAAAARLAAGRQLLYVGAWRTAVFVGPLWTHGVPGCPYCLLSRTANSEFGPLCHGERMLPSSRRDDAAVLLGPDRLLLAELSVRAALADADRYREGVLLLDRGTARQQVLLPDTSCPACGERGTDTGPRFTSARVPLRKLSPGVLRTAQLPADTVGRDYLFAGAGLFQELRHDLQSPFGACSVELTTRWGRREPAIGRASSYRGSRSVAVLEGLERYAGLHRGGTRPAVRAAYQDIAADAVYPPSLGHHPAESYRAEGFRYRPFQPDTVVDWVRAYSFREDRTVLLPERAAFWGPRHDDETAFCYDTSNGCALGNSVEEATLHGLREVAERDSYLLTWYRRLALPEVDLAAHPDQRLAVLLARARLFAGVEFRCFLSTMEYGMPSCWLVAENTTGSGPSVLTGSGSHPDPVQAVVGGLHELVGTILAARSSYPERRAEGLRMLRDPQLITAMEHHSLAGSVPEARPRYAFLLDEPPPARIALADVPGTIRLDTDDLRADLDVAVRGVLDAGLDVLVVEQTMPELARNGLRCVRVLVPGTVPMTFGHRNRRTAGLPRLSGASPLPYRSGLAPGEEVGCLPHPFP